MLGSPDRLNASAPACSGWRDMASARLMAADSFGHSCAWPAATPSSVLMNGSTTQYRTDIGSALQGRLLDEPFGQRLGQCGDGELLPLAENGAYSAQNVSDARRSQDRR